MIIVLTNICNKNLHILLCIICIKKPRGMYFHFQSKVTKLKLEDSECVYLGSDRAGFLAISSNAFLFHLTSIVYKKISTVSFILMQFLSPFQVLNRPNPTYFQRSGQISHIWPGMTVSN